MHIWYFYFRLLLVAYKNMNKPNPKDKWKHGYTSSASLNFLGRTPEYLSFWQKQPIGKMAGWQKADSTK